MSLIYYLEFTVYSLIIQYFRKDILMNDENRYFTASSEMIEKGNYIVPTLNYEMYPDKPPFLFWLMSILLRLTKNFSFIRLLLTFLPNLFSIYLLELISFYFEVKLNLKYLLSNIIFLFISQILMTDHIMYTCIFANIYFTLKNWYVYTIITSCIGFLIKGPIFLLNLAIYSYSFNILNYNQLYGLLGGVLWVILALTFGSKEYREHILWKQWLGRAMGKHKHNKPIYFFLPMLPIIYNFIPNNFSLYFQNSLIYIGTYTLSKSKLPHYMLGAVFIYSFNTYYLFNYSWLIFVLIGLGLITLPFLELKETSNFDYLDNQNFVKYGILTIATSWRSSIAMIVIFRLICIIYKRYFTFNKIIEICDQYDKHKIYYQKTFYNGEINFLLKNKRKINLGEIDIIPEKSLYICFQKLDKYQEIYHNKFANNQSIYIYKN